MQWWELDELYREQLLREVRPPIAGHVIPWEVRAQLVWMEYARGKELAVEEVDRTWIWSDPHFDHEGIIEHGGRPHPDATAMTSMLCAAWRARVGTDDTIVSSATSRSDSPSGRRSCAWEPCRDARSW